MTAPAIPDLTKYIEARFFEARPHIRDRRIPVATVAYNAHNNAWSVERLADEFGLSETEILAALLYYQLHQQEIDDLEDAEQAALDHLRDLHDRPR